MDRKIEVTSPHSGRTLQIGFGGYLRPVYLLMYVTRYSAFTRSYYEDASIEKALGWIDTRKDESLESQALSLAHANGY